MRVRWSVPIRIDSSACRAVTNPQFFLMMAPIASSAADLIKFLVGEFFLVTHEESLSGAGEYARASGAVRYEVQ
jgi:hypothetical protein